ncbi:transcriptional regulator [Nonomuraea sp. SMC257]|uniref:Transcriptional regulator n=1 Tax=Nonomuraea montanisoli TaxID=2741721 RepID=A0A7Y6IFD6_9ACTN|nr:transcriptional regulator [Nonomuraea montanisoli]NUW36610.1 transcriptional regulator [Nonomuraea montanisoli]
MPRKHPRLELDAAIHAPIRFSLVAVLSTEGECAFQQICHQLAVNAATLSKNVAYLETAGYVEVRKGFVGKRPRTWLSLTPAGLEAFNRHTAALHAISHVGNAP